MHKNPLRLALAFIAMTLPTLALAHVGHDAGMHDGFAAGFTHPFTGIDHLAAMLLIGLCSARLERRSRWLTPAVFVIFLLLGALLASAGMAVPAIEPGIALSLVVLGALFAARSALPVAVMAPVAALFAVFHGAAHGTELAGPAAVAGMAAATALLHAGGLLAGLELRRHSVWWPRVAGIAGSLFGAALLFGAA